MLHTPVTTSPFHEIPGNPAPDRATAGFMTARDGLRLRYARFGATGRPLKGTVIILPGRNECIEKYFETIRDLSARGLGSALVDWRGQGDSGRMLRDPARGYVDNFYDYVRDLEQFFEEIVLPDCRGPFYMLGHSTGSLVALLAAPVMINRVRRMVLCVPLLSLAGFPFSMQTIRRICQRALRHRPRQHVHGGRRPAARDQAVLDQRADHRSRRATGAIRCSTRPIRKLALGGPTVAWVRAACIAAETVQDPDFIATDADPDAVRRGRLRRGRLDAGDRTLRAADQIGLAAHHRRRAPRDLAGGGYLSRAVARRLRRLHSRQ